MTRTPRRHRADGAAALLRKTIGVQVVIDEVHNTLAGACREQRVVLNTLLFLSESASGIARLIRA
ncbi:TniB family NTP-binding protein [Mesorhizobium sp.]|uniref:TniB family NTP-binding protein n=1 Tax=Mesorhizobium sp. TaxID=1871066 RepID=UPI0025DB2952|nr:TniB family NTP-binding protein [Mesorhizobium sp.]